MSDVICSSIDVDCPDGHKFVEANTIDAAFGESNPSPCQPCPSGKTAYNNQNECKEINLSFTCQENFYLKTPITNQTKADPLTLCVAHTKCALFTTDGTPTSDRQCVSAGTPACTCPPGFWRRPDAAGNAIDCIPHRRCPHGWVKTEGDCFNNRVCATVGSEQYLYESVIGVFGGLVLAVGARVWVNHDAQT